MEDNVFQYHDDFKVTDEMKDAWREGGFFIVRGMLGSKEVSLLTPALESDDGLRKYSFGLDDGEGSFSRVCLWRQPGNDITGMIFRSRKMVDTAEELLGGEVYHYHTKLMMKESHTGGSTAWHQDYGSWYKNGCLFPDMLTVLVAVDKCDKENGCLQVIKGSHKMGRLDTIKIGGQTACDPERIEQAKKILPPAYVDMEPGDALFISCTILHKSDQNKSARRRWMLICAYNKATNNPVKKHHLPLYTPLTKVCNEAIMTCNNKTDMTDKDFLDPLDDKTIHHPKKLEM